MIKNICIHFFCTKESKSFVILYKNYVECNKLFDKYVFKCYNYNNKYLKKYSLIYFNAVFCFCTSE